MQNGFVSLATELFRFLENDFGFEVVEAAEDGQCGFVTYDCQKSGVAIRVEFDPECQYLFIYIYRLVNGRRIEPKPPIRQDSKIDCIEFTDALASADQMKPGYEYDDDSPFFDEQNCMKNYIQEFAKRLRNHGKDFLRGDFRRFSKIETIIKKRTSKMK